MAKVRARKDSGLLFMDFYYRGVRCREQTALPDTAENRRRVQSGNRHPLAQGIRVADDHRHTNLAQLRVFEQGLGGDFGTDTGNVAKGNGQSGQNIQGHDEWDPIKVKGRICPL